MLIPFRGFWKRIKVAYRPNRRIAVPAREACPRLQSDSARPRKIRAMTPNGNGDIPAAGRLVNPRSVFR